MTENGVRSGGSPRAPRPDDFQEPDAPPSAAHTPPDDWLAPEPLAEAAPLADDWLAPEPAAPLPEDEPLAEDAPLADDALDEGEPLAGADALEDDELEAAEPPRLPLSERLRRTPPALVILALAAIGSSGFLAFELASRTAPIAVLSSASVVAGLCYVAISTVCSIATYRAATDGRTRQAFLLALIGGGAAIVAAAAFAGALVLVLALGF
jgi:hypothetical protein